MGVANDALNNALSIANNDSHGYDQGNRWGPDYDCSSLVITAYKKAGVPLTCTYTGNILTDMVSKGFKNVTGLINLTTGAGLQPGDVLLNVVNHTAMYVGNGQIVQASSNEFGKVTGGKTGDQTGREISVRSYYNFPWDYVLRYTDQSSTVTVTQQTTVTVTTPSTEIQNGIYTVQSGDTLSGIALKLLGNGNRYYEIASFNGITNPNALKVGQQLKIPGFYVEPTEAIPVHEAVIKDNIKIETCTPTLPVLKYGDNGMSVRKLQKLLEACGYSISADGDFGSSTLNTVKYLQKAKGIKEDGIVGAETYEALMS